MEQKNNGQKEILKEFLKCFINCFCIINQYNKCYFVLSILFISVQGLMPVVSIIMMQKIINMLQNGGYQFAAIIICVGIYIFSNIVSDFVSTLYSYYNAQNNLKFNQYVNLRMLDKSTKLKLKDYEDSETYNIINRAQDQNGTSILTYVAEIMEIIRQIITIVSIAFVLAAFRWWIIFLVLLLPVIRCIVTINIDNQWYKLRISRTRKERESWYISYLFMTGKAYKEIRIQGLSGYLSQKYRRILNECICQDTIMQKKLAGFSLFFDVIDWGVTGGIFAYTVFLGYGGRIFLGDVTAYIDAVSNIKNSIQEVFTNIGTIAEQSLYINLLFDFLDIPTEDMAGKKKISHIEKIELENVCFKYGDGYVLKDINMTLKPGQTVAFVGENGSGKSTLIKVILGFYDDYEGCVKVNGTDLRTIDIESYQKQIGCVFQDYMKYETSINENVLYGDIIGDKGKNEIQNVLSKTGMKEKVEKLGGTEVIVGNWFGEQELSIGEWQRIAVARALIRDADMYVFDEPDASLDILNQKELLAVYRAEMACKIGIYVSHKVDSVHSISSMIYVLEKGEIIERGSHEELLQLDGKYCLMFQNCQIVSEYGS